MDFTDLSIVIPLVLLVFCLLGISWFAGSAAPYVPTKYRKMKKILQEAGVEKDSVFYELGSGDGRVCFDAGELGARVYGIEQSWVRVIMSRYVAWRKGLKKVQFIHGDIFKRKYNGADVVFIYLLPPAVADLEKILQHELKKGAMVITQTYHFPNWKPTKTVDNFQFYKA